MPLNSATTLPAASAAPPAVDPPCGCGSRPRSASRDWLIVHYGPAHHLVGGPDGESGADRPAAVDAVPRLVVGGDVEPPAPLTAGHRLAGVDAHGRFGWVRLRPGARAVTVELRGADGVPSGPYQVDPARTGEVWLTPDGPQPDAGHPAGTPAAGPPAATAGHGVPAGTVAILHYRPADTDADGHPDGARPADGDPAAQAEGGGEVWGLHVWTGAAEPTTWSAPLAPGGRDDFGWIFEVPLAAGATTLSYLPHRGDRKDPAGDRHLDVGAGHREAWLLGGIAQPLRPEPRDADGPVDLTRSRAYWLDAATVAWHHDGGDPHGRVWQLACAPDGLAIVGGELSGRYSTVDLTPVPGGLTDAQRAKFPHLAGCPVLRPAHTDRRVLADALRGHVVAVERDADGRLLRATGVQLPGVLDDLYPAAGTAPLGVTVTDGRPTLGVWAPTARTVDLEVFDAPAAEPAVVPMTRDDLTGVWSASGPADWLGRWYRYRVRVWQPAVQRVVTASVTDPYSVALAADSTHSQVVDLADPALAPPGWAQSPRPPAVAPTRMQILELHVRDFSVADASVPAERRGGYLAFTDPHTAGMRHLRTLAEAGLSHVHLLPVFDFATVPERRAGQARPDGDLAAFGPDSAEQQARVAAVADTDGFNWGYDPLHYTTPEGGYAVEPDGAARTVEFRQMVAGLHRAGLRVIMDVVYNHTMAAGNHPHSVLDRIVPGYYHRLLDDGRVADSTCCANTAPEHAMMGRLVVDSVLTWATAYRVDGFRFDLMGHHPLANILAVRAALDRLTLDRDGVDGRSIYLYGEGWDFGEVWGGSRFVQATQHNTAGTGIGTFNDRLRDAARGGAPFEASPRGQGFATGLFTDPNGDPVNGPPEHQLPKLLHLQDQIKVGLAGNLADYRFVSAFGPTLTGAQVDNNGSPTGYAASPAETVTFVDAHDNEILYDALAYKLPPHTSMLDRARMQVLALALAVLSQGVGFVTAGSERLRSKSLDRNSYNSGDWFNAIRWDTAQGNGFGLGLPPAHDNRDKWAYAQPLLADPALVADPAAIELTTARYLELLRIAGSSPLFSLGSAEEIQRRLSFPLSGPGETPGVITMQLDGVGLDPRWSTVVVVFNAGPSAVTETLPELRGAEVSLHPVLLESADPVLLTALFDPVLAHLVVPARSVAVFVRE